MKHEAYPAQPILIVDDEVSERARIEAILRGAGIDHLVSVSRSAEAEGLLDGKGACLVLLDLEAGGGVALVAELAERCPGLPLIVVTGASDARCNAPLNLII